MSQPININTATFDQLKKIKGIYVIRELVLLLNREQKRDI